MCNQHHQYSIFNSSSFSQSDGGTSDVSFTKLFIQPSFGLTFNSFDIAFSTRFCSLTFNTIANNTYGNTDLYDELNSLGSKIYLFLEPAVTIRGGWKNVKLQIQTSFANIFNKSDLSFVERPHISIGLDNSFAGKHK